LVGELELLPHRPSRLRGGSIRQFGVTGGRLQYVLLVLIYFNVLISHLNIFIDNPPGAPAGFSIGEILPQPTGLALEDPVEFLKLSELRITHVGLRLCYD
jgi:hypothetical protein